MELIVLDTQLQPVGIVDQFRSLIWASRYWEVGDCEVYTEATTETLQLFQMGRYLAREDDDMVCQIRKIEIQTDVEGGNYLIVTGVDVRAFFDQRIVWGTEFASGSLEDFVKTLVMHSWAGTNRDMQIFTSSATAGITDQLDMQVSYKGVGATIRDICKGYGLGYRVKKVETLNGERLQFGLYKGKDRTGAVVFCEEYENLAESDYSLDRTKLGNAAIVAGYGEGANRAIAKIGTASGLDRWEIFVDAKDIAQTVLWSEFSATYPPTSEGGTGTWLQMGDVWGYQVNPLDIPILGHDHLAWLEENYPAGSVVEVDGHDVYRMSTTIIATCETNEPDDDTTLQIRLVLYNTYLANRGFQKLATYGERESFAGTVIPDVTFIFKTDYFLGDIVTVRNEFGISADARITEVVEVEDETGYRIEPHFEYKQED